MRANDKPADRPTVPEVAAKLIEYRKLPHRYTGGCVHICVDDPNFEQHHADWCVENAEKWAREWGGLKHLAADIEIARLVAALTTSQRRRLAALNTYPDMQPGGAA